MRWVNQYTRPTPINRSQAQRVIDKFGGSPEGIKRLARGLDCSVHAIYRWTYPTDRGGTGGLVPSRAMQKIVVLAREEGIFLDAEDTDPHPRP